VRKIVVEFIGTFFLVFVVGMCVVKASTEGTGSIANLEHVLFGDLAPVAIGSTLMIMVYAGGHISGGYYNPAVTIGAWIRGNCLTSDVVPYIVAQIIAGVLAAGLTLYLKGFPAVQPITQQIGPALVAEFLFTFALVYVVLQTATTKATAGNSYYGLAIGFTILCGAYAVGDISGGAFNPAVAVGITTMGVSSWSNIWIFFVAELLGAVAAAFAFKAIVREP
jgi:aquaporin Z